MARTFGATSGPRIAPRSSQRGALVTEAFRDPRRIATPNSLRTFRPSRETLPAGLHDAVRASVAEAAEQYGHIQGTHYWELGDFDPRLAGLRFFVTRELEEKGALGKSEYEAFFGTDPDHQWASIRAQHATRINDLEPLYMGIRDMRGKEAVAAAGPSNIDGPRGKLLYCNSAFVASFDQGIFTNGDLRPARDLTRWIYHAAHAFTPRWAERIWDTPLGVAFDNVVGNEYKRQMFLGWTFMANRGILGIRPDEEYTTDPVLAPLLFDAYLSCIDRVAQAEEVQVADFTNFLEGNYNGNAILGRNLWAIKHPGHNEPVLAEWGAIRGPGLFTAVTDLISNDGDGANWFRSTQYPNVNQGNPRDPDGEVTLKFPYTEVFREHQRAVANWVYEVFYQFGYAVETDRYGIRVPGPFGNVKTIPGATFKDVQKRVKELRPQLIELAKAKRERNEAQAPELEALAKAREAMNEAETARLEALANAIKAKHQAKVTELEELGKSRAELNKAEIARLEARVRKQGEKFEPEIARLTANIDRDFFWKEFRLHLGEKPPEGETAAASFARHGDARTRELEGQSLTEYLDWTPEHRAFLEVLSPVMGERFCEWILNLSRKHAKDSAERIEDAKVVRESLSVEPEFALFILETLLKPFEAPGARFQEELDKTNESAASDEDIRTAFAGLDPAKPADKSKLDALADAAKARLLEILQGEFKTNKTGGLEQVKAGLDGRNKDQVGKIFPRLFGDLGLGHLTAAAIAACTPPPVAPEKVVQAENEDKKSFDARVKAAKTAAQEEGKRLGNLQKEAFVASISLDPTKAYYFLTDVLGLISDKAGSPTIFAQNRKLLIKVAGLRAITSFADVSRLFEQVRLEREALERENITLDERTATLTEQRNEVAKRLRIAEAILEDDPTRATADEERAACRLDRETLDAIEPELTAAEARLKPAREALRRTPDLLAPIGALARAAAEDFVTTLDPEDAAQVSLLRNILGVPEEGARIAGGEGLKPPRVTTKNEEIARLFTSLRFEDLDPENPRFQDAVDFICCRLVNRLGFNDGVPFDQINWEALYAANPKLLKELFLQFPYYRKDAWVRTKEYDETTGRRIVKRATEWFPGLRMGTNNKDGDKGVYGNIEAKFWKLAREVLGIRSILMLEAFTRSAERMTEETAKKNHDKVDAELKALMAGDAESTSRLPLSAELDFQLEDRKKRALNVFRGELKGIWRDSMLERPDILLALYEDFLVQHKENQVTPSQYVERYALDAVAQFVDNPDAKFMGKKPFVVRLMPDIMTDQKKFTRAVEQLAYIRNKAATNEGGISWDSIEMAQYFRTLHNESEEIELDEAQMLKIKERYGYPFEEPAGYRDTEKKKPFWKMKTFLFIGMEDAETGELIACNTLIFVDPKKTTSFAGLPAGAPQKIGGPHHTHTSWYFNLAGTAAAFFSDVGLKVAMLSTTKPASKAEMGFFFRRSWNYMKYYNPFTAAIMKILNPSVLQASALDDMETMKNIPPAERARRNFILGRKRTLMDV